MKKTKLTMVFSLLSVMLMAQNDKPGIAFKDMKIEKAYASYLELKDALVASKTARAKEAAEKLRTSLVSLKEGNNAMAEATKIAGSATLDEIRKAFAKLSAEMATVVKDGKLSKGMIYLEYCPMANNNTGAFWLSNEKEIKNPYFGDKMLKCGSVRETIH